MDKRIYELQADLFKAIAHPLRLEVLEILNGKEICFTDILQQTGGLKSNLSQHMSVMTKQGILSVRREGSCNYYSVTSDRVHQACTLFREMMLEQHSTLNSVMRTLHSTN